MSTKFVQNKFIQECQSVVCTINGFLDIESFKNGALESLDIIIEHKGIHLILDVSEMKVLPDSVIKWMRNHWYASVSNSNISHVYFITPRNIFGKMSIQSANKLIDTFKPKISVSYHSDASILLKELSGLTSYDEIKTRA